MFYSLIPCLKFYYRTTISRTVLGWGWQWNRAAVCY